MTLVHKTFVSSPKNRLLFFAIIIGLFAIGLTFIDDDYSERWLCFNLWVLSFGLAFAALHGPFKLEQIKALAFTRVELVLFSGLMIFAVATRLLFVNVYPFAPIGDGMRDGGLAAANIANGGIKTIFDYDYDNAHNLIIPTFTSFFYRFLGNTVLIYRIPAALVSIFGGFVLYLTVRKFAGKTMAFWATLVMLSLPLNLFYSRTEIVVILSSFWTTLTLLVLGKFLQERSLKNYGYLGLIIGSGMGFHAALKTVALLAVLIVVVVSTNYYLKKIDRKIIAQGLCFMALLMLIGLGPRTIFTTPDVLFQTNKLTVLKDDTTTTSDDDLLAKLVRPFQNYPRSLMVYIDQPTTSHYHDRKPILNFVLSVFFVVGLVLVLFYGSAWLKMVGIFALVLPFTNSAITDAINADHRLTPLLPVSSILVAFGFVEISRRLVRPGFFYKAFRVSLALVLLISSGLSVYWFFEEEPASYSMYQSDDSLSYRDYMLTYAIKTVKTDPVLTHAPSPCFTISPQSEGYYNLLHIQEQFEFFLPGQVVNLNVNPSLDDHQLYLSSSCEENPPLSSQSWEALNYCTTNEKFICPPNKTTFKIYRQKA